MLTGMIVGYEVAHRVGRCWHDHHEIYQACGSWGTVACAAAAANLMGLTPEQARHALGIAEYHGPRSQMMRCIDHPTMVKDGSGWAAMAGVSAGLLAAAGFTGAPALTVEDAAIKNIWADTGREWHILVQFFKPYPVCYWAQAPIAGAVQLQKAHGLAPADIAAIRVYTFHEATRLATRRPETTDEAQYSLPFPVAAALVHGRVGLEALRGAGLQDPAVLALVDKVEMVEEQTFNDRFPAERLARVEIETVSGRVLDSGEVRPLWDLSAPPADAELHEKFHQLVAPTLPAGRAAALEHAAWHCADLPDATALLALLAPPS